MGAVSYSIYAKIVMHLRSLYSKIIGVEREKYFTDYSESNREIIQNIIYEKIMSGKPFMAARLGRTELQVLENLKYTFYARRSNLNYIRWKGQPNFINWQQMRAFYELSGFYPWDDIDALKHFYQLMMDCMKQVDVLGSWLYNEQYFEEELKNSIKVDRERMTPLLTKDPWTRALEGKKVLVIHPFKKTIESQYARREKLFPTSPNILPEFDLSVIKAVQSLGCRTEFSDWFSALDYMKNEMNKVDYDVCLLGCGAYGFPLAAYAKECGKQAIHLGGVLQLLFGIKGKRWETDPGYINDFPYAKTYYNEYWVRASVEETPDKANNVENGCYW